MLVTCVGVLVCDIIAADLPKVSGPGEVVFAPRGIELYIGGHSANVSIDLMKLGLQKGEVSSVGAIGSDLFGNFVETELMKYGVVTHLKKEQRAGTSKDLILVVKGEDRRFHVDVGANLWVDPDLVRAIVREEKPVVFYVGATGLLGKFDEQLAELLQEAKRLGCTTFVDPVIPYEHGWEPLLSALRWTDIFHCNNVEASSITGEKGLQESIEALMREGAKLVVVTMGEGGLVARSEEIALDMAAFMVPVIDPTGAGDAFCAGMIYGFLQSTGRKKHDISSLSPESLIHILLEGEAAGAACVTAIGTTTAVTRQKVDKLLKEQGSTIFKSALASSKPRTEQ